MSGEVSTVLDRTRSATDDARALAVTYLNRTGNADLLEMLGLAEPAEPEASATQERPADDEPTVDPEQALYALRQTAVAAFSAGVAWHQALTVLREARKNARPKRQLKGCPSEAAYRRHLKAGEKCRPCRDFMHRVELKRRSLHPEWALG